MSISVYELEKAFINLLSPKEFRDYCPNGLQVEGKPDIHKLVTGVTASQALIDAAIAAQADALFVHHGYFWQGENPVIRGMKKQRLKTLLEHEISLFAYHLPLDDHPKLGNNAQLGDLLGFTTEGQLQPGFRSKVGVWGNVIKPLNGKEMADHIGNILEREVMHVPGEKKHIDKIAWCTGGGQNYIEKAVDLGVDAYLTGEVSEQTVHIARETGIHFFAAGHHATERYGVQAVGEHLAREFDIEHMFIDIDNPV